ncbi:polyprenyl synthetase family protein [Paraliomyxa miuraensis]|uniref:polyprenyl synthetase family protein n=1 Tax=Paraliomyxa miuraensis TaxID=376150 RepID=UPI0022569C68|nr:polyprenyl synthetase family protein [Paraliomyxa miuraensis]MCX4244834.1 polyprenyl synthetase family protein [Paraliomyxa miuraensis]
MNETDLMAYFEERRTLVDRALDELLAMPAGGEDPLRLREAMRYAVLEGGKRMRPLLTIAACEAVGGTAAHAMPAACAVELVHAYSLVHDDMPAMDDDAERRGRPTVHVAFGEAAAVLTGDALLTLAFGAFAGARGGPGRPFEASLELATRSGIDGMVGGQAIDLHDGQDIRELERLERLHALKTGGLYQASGAMGALLGGADDALVARMRRFGLAFGIAFQHADDVLDGDQPALREQALRRVDELVAECTELTSGLGAAADPLRGIAQWVGDRASKAMAGTIAD